MRLMVGLSIVSDRTGCGDRSELRFRSLGSKPLTTLDLLQSSPAPEAGSSPRKTGAPPILHPPGNSLRPGWFVAGNCFHQICVQCCWGQDVRLFSQELRKCPDEPSSESDSGQGSRRKNS